MSIPVAFCQQKAKMHVINGIRMDLPPNDGNTSITVQADILNKPDPLLRNVKLQ
jgi:hypothetical protein